MAGFTKVALYLAVLSLALESGVAVKVQELRPGRSATWDEHLRQPRDTSGLEWHRDSANCNSMEYTRYDALARRNSQLLAGVEDQGTCGNCWAFAAVHAFSDFRSLLADRVMPLLSAEYITLCATEVTDGKRYNGCCGEQHGRAMKHFVEQGTVSVGCLSFSLADYIPREISNNTVLTKRFKNAEPLECPAMCGDKEEYVTEANKLAEYDFTENGLSDSELKGMILQSGPVAASMMLDEGLLHHYQCGVYQASNFSDMGRHAVEIVDFGISPLGTSFWVVKNSWGVNWGENGYFRIKMGDLQIGKKDYPISIPLRPGMTQTYGEAVAADFKTELRACGAHVMTNPNDNTLFQSVSTFGLEDMQNRGLFVCPDGSNATNTELVKVCTGTLQVVAGSIAFVCIESKVEGCDNNTVATVFLKVAADMNNTFTLTEYDIIFNERCSGTALQSSIVLIFLLIVAAVEQLF